MKLEKIHEYTMQMPHEMYDYMIFSLTYFKRNCVSAKSLFLYLPRNKITSECQDLLTNYYLDNYSTKLVFVIFSNTEFNYNFVFVKCFSEMFSIIHYIIATRELIKTRWPLSKNIQKVVWTFYFIAVSFYYGSLTEDLIHLPARIAYLSWIPFHNLKHLQ